MIVLRHASLLLVILMAAASAAPEERRPEDNAALWYWRAISHLPLNFRDDDDTESTRSFMADPLAEVPEQLKQWKNEFSFGMIELQKAISKPYCEFAIDRENGPRMLLPHVGALRCCIALACVHARDAAMNGDSHTAAADLAMCYRIAVQVGNDHVLISSLAACLFISTIDKLVADGLRHHLFSTKDKAELLLAMKSIDTKDFLGTISSVAAEQQVMVEWAEREFAGDGGVARFLKFACNGEEPPPLLLQALTQDKFDRSLHKCRKTLDEFISAFREPDPDQAMKRLDQLKESLEENPHVLDDRLVARVLISDLPKLYRSMTDAHRVVQQRIAELGSSPTTSQSDDHKP